MRPLRPLQDYSEVQLVLRMPRPLAAGPAPPATHPQYGSVDDMAALIERLQSQLQVKEREKQLTASALQRKVGGGMGWGCGPQLQRMLGLFRESGLQARASGGRVQPAQALWPLGRRGRLLCLPPVGCVRRMCSQSSPDPTTSTATRGPPCLTCLPAGLLRCSPRSATT